jgi:hypothetical protein
VWRYLLLRREQLKLNSLRPILGAIKFFYRVTVPREWPTLRAMRLPKHRTVPLVLPPEKCWRLIQETRTLHLQTFFHTAYTCGLRQGNILDQRADGNFHASSKKPELTSVSATDGMGVVGGLSPTFITAQSPRRGNTM